MMLCLLVLVLDNGAVFRRVCYSLASVCFVHRVAELVGWLDGWMDGWMQLLFFAECFSPSPRPNHDTACLQLLTHMAVMPVLFSFS